MGTGESLTASAKVQRLQTALHAKAKEAPGLRFYSLNDKVWREDVLAVAWQVVRRNGGAAGVDGETVADIEAFGVERWLGVLARDLNVQPHELWLKCRDFCAGVFWRRLLPTARRGSLLFPECLLVLKKLQVIFCAS